MLMPKRVKYRKQFRGSMAGKAMRGNQITHGTYGLVATEPCWLKSNQIEFSLRSTVSLKQRLRRRSALQCTSFRASAGSRPGKKSTER